MCDPHDAHESLVLVDPHEHAIRDTDVAGAESFEFRSERFRRAQRILRERPSRNRSTASPSFGGKRPNARAAGLITTASWVDSTLSTRPESLPLVSLTDIVRTLPN